MDSNIHALHKKVEGLLYYSETEYPVTPFTIDVTSKEDIVPFIALYKNAEEQFIKNILPEDFFARFENYLAYGGPDEIMNDNAREFIALRDFLKNNFLHTFIYRIEKPGEAVIPVFIIAQLKDGSFTGLETTAVET